MEGGGGLLEMKNAYFNYPINQQLSFGIKNNILICKGRYLQPNYFNKEMYLHFNLGPFHF